MDKNGKLFLREPYVTQFSTMAPELRSAVLSRYDLDAFEDTAAMSLLYYYLDPCAFGIKVYRHFLRMQDGTAFLHELIDGRVELGKSQAESW